MAVAKRTQQKGRTTRRRKPLALALECQCGAKGRVFELQNGYMAHCPGCGTLSFFHNPELLERIARGGQLCPHNVQQKACLGGTTSWCPTCRLRTFYRST